MAVIACLHGLSINVHIINVFRVPTSVCVLHRSFCIHFQHREKTLTTDVFGSKTFIARTRKLEKKLESKKYDRVCSVHFVDGKPTKDHPYPELLLGKGNTNIPTRRCRRMVIRQPVIKPHTDYQQHVLTSDWGWHKSSSIRHVTPTPALSKPALHTVNSNNVTLAMWQPNHTIVHNLYSKTGRTYIT